MSPADYFGRWRELAREAAELSVDPSRQARELATTASIARTDWIVPVEGKAEGWLVNAFLDACKAHGAAETVRLREVTGPVLNACAQAVGGLLPSPPPPPGLPFRRDLDA